ncbi:MAG TPA: GntR family transcriptional regulator [Phycisphaerae bacterium]|nr:GntR family transcriptional regulator [Phycisphaerae bacterium]
MLSNNKNLPYWATGLAIKPDAGPIFRQIKAWAIRAITESLFSPGELFPSEVQLAKVAGISRLTVRQATNELVAEGLLIREQGKRPRVAMAKTVTHFLELGGISRYLDSQGKKYYREVLCSEIQACPSEIAKILNLKKHNPIFMLERIRSTEYEKLGWEKTWMNRALCPGIENHDFSVESLYKILISKYGIMPHRADGIIDVAVAGSEHSKMLDVKEGAPLLSVRRTVYTDDNKPLQFNHEIYRGDRYSFAFNVKNLQ